MKTILPLLALLLFSCNNSSKLVTNNKDYNQYLNSDVNVAKDFSVSEIIFWGNKFENSPNQISYLSKIAANYAALFEITGDINNLYQAEKLLIKANKAFSYSEVGTIRALARNYITQHRFKEALTLAQKANKIGEGKVLNHQLLFDVQMELGNYTEAKINLDAIKNFNDFDYLFRLAKWSDHKGNLDYAITLMEKATKQAEISENKYLKTWSYSNLADMYGHSGKIEKSYQYYLKTLSLDSNNSYALKGIAWIAFSHEKNTIEAKKILDNIAKKHNSPDFYLLKSEIAEFENNNTQKEIHLTDYFTMLNKNNYGVMYNKYNALLFAEDNKKVEKAITIAKQEIQNRPTPDSYDLLAWAYYNAGQKEKALQIAKKYVANKSFEPELTYHLATIYKSQNKTNEIKALKSDLQSSIFELGPNMQTKIDNL